MKKKIFLGLGILVFFAIGIGLFLMNQSIQTTKPTSNMKVSGEIRSVERGDIKVGVFSSGNVKSAEVEVFSYDPTKKVTVHVKDGQAVSKGALLFETYDPDLSSQYDQAVLKRSQARGMFNQAKALPVTTPDKDSQIQAQKAALDEANTQVNALADKIANLKIRATFNGVISIREAKVTSGQGAGESPPSVKLYNPNKLIIPIAIDEVEYPMIKVGDKVNFTLAAYPDQTFKGTVAALGKEGYTENNNVNFPGTISVDYDAKILPGMTADVSIVIQDKKNIIILPLNAVKEGEGGKKFVTVVKADNTREKREITTGVSDDNNIEITTGLKEGEQIEIEPTGMQG